MRIAFQKLKENFKYLAYFKRKYLGINPNSFDQIYPKCMVSTAQHVIGADQNYYPCCFTRVDFGKMNLEKLLSEDFKELNILTNKRIDIIHSKAWNKLIDSFSENPMETCLMFCGKDTKPSSKFDGRNNYNRFEL